MTRQKVQMVRPFVFLCLLLGAFFEQPLAASADIFHIFSNHFERVNSSDEIIFIQKSRDAKKLNKLTNFALLSTEGEGRHGIYGELRAFIRTNDRPKAIIQIDGQTIAHQIYSEPFCWLKGICWSQTRTDTFVLCNDRFGPILRILLENGCKKTDEKGKEMKIGGTEGAKKTGGWSTAFTGVLALSNGKRSKKDGKANKEEQLINIETMSEGEQRRKCQYRISCYEREGLLGHLSGKRQKQSGTLLSGKVAPPEGHKRTMKQMAKMAMKEVQRNEEEGKTKKQMDERDGETVLANYWNEREKKLRCKYRKSCYKTGQKATIERSALALWWEGTEERGGGEEGEKKQTEGEEGKEKLDKMGEKQRKAFCQYRKSCYESGRRTTAEEERKEWQWDEMMDIEIGIGKKVNEYWSKLRRMVKGGRKGTERKKEENGESGEKAEEKEKSGEKAEEREKSGEKAEEWEEAQMRKKVDCKYRRSCYETGQLPEALKRQKETEEDGGEGTMGRKKVPSSVKELKLYCKYRKSCYVTSATATKITELRAENSGNRTNGERAESEQIEKIVGDGQRGTKRQTKSMKNSEKTREGTEERDRGETQKRKTNMIRRKTKDKKEEDGSKEDGKGEQEKREESEEEKREGKEEEKREETREAEQEEEMKGGAEEEEPNREERREKEEDKREGREEGKRKDGRGESEQKDEEEEVEEKGKGEMEKKGVEKDERKKRQKRRKMNCSPEKLVKDKKEKVEGCKEKKNREEEEASSVKEDEKKSKRKERKKKEREEEEEEEQMRKMRKRKKKYQRIKRGIKMMRHLGKEEEKEEKREEQKEGDREKKKEMEEEKGEEKNRSKLKKKRKKYKVEAAHENEKKTKVWERKWQGLSRAKRLECRYRKSCYATGTRQTIRRWTTGEGDQDERWGQSWQWTDLWATIPWKYEKKQNGEKEPKKKWERIEGWHGINERQKKFKCKYRKSCYERMEQQMERDGTGGEAQRSGRTEPKREKPMKAVDITQKTMAREADKRKRDETRRREAILKSTHLGIKLECKYRKSCYEERENRLMTVTQQQIVAPPPPINVAKKRNETKAQIGEAIARGGSQNCNQWRISCQEAMGLTVRETTPIGKDGKKLCRKKNAEKEKRGAKW